MEAVEAELRRAPRLFLVTGAAGFIGSHLTARLLRLGQRVRGLDNFATSHRRALDGVELIEGDIQDLATCRRACEGVDVVLHQAALRSVVRSMEDPLRTYAVNVDGFANVLLAARDAGVRRLVYASSSSVYGDEPSTPQREDRVGRPLSPYAASKLANEALAASFRRGYGVPAIGLRYFNVYGEGQDADDPYATVIPRWIQALARGGTCEIFGDGSSSRDFCHVDDAVQANLLAAVADPAPPSDVYNVAVGETTTLEALFRQVRGRVSLNVPEAARAEPRYRPSRRGDLRHSRADLTRVRAELGYAPTIDVTAGVDRTVAWFFARAVRPDTRG